METRITYRQVIDRLQESHLTHTTLSLPGGARIVITERGGRILGPFLTVDGTSMMWLSESFAAAEAFQAFLDAEDWNLGGERVRVGPELQYSVPDRSRFWETYTLSAEDDPGRYVLSAAGTGGAWRLSKDMVLDVYPSRGRKRLHMDRLISEAADPLRELVVYRELMDGVVYAGYDHRITLEEPESDGIVSHAWDLVQINVGGVLVIPVLPPIEYSDYYEPLEAGTQVRTQHHLCLKITADRKFKRGFKAPHILGRVGYFNQLGPDQACLLVRTFYSNPSSSYLDEPYRSPGCRGDSLQVYQDDGALGAFAEIECIGETVGGNMGRSTTTDAMLLWCYMGAPAKVGRIAKHLIGLDPVENS